VQGWGENATGNQSLLLLGAAFQTAGNDARHGLVAVAYQYLFAISHELNMGAELCFQIADIDGSHVAIIADVTMLVICYFTVWNVRAMEHRHMHVFEEFPLFQYPLFQHVDNARDVRPIPSGFGRRTQPG